MEITSLQHAVVKHFVSLRKDATYRKESNSLLLIGDNIVQEYPFSIKCLISKEPVSLPAKNKYLATEEILQKIAGLGTFSGMIAEVEMPQAQNIEDKNFVLILDQIQDPGNLGTLIRTAVAFGWDAVVATPGTVDFFNDKALRASQGAIFRIPFAYKSSEEIVSWVQKKKVHLWVADMLGTAVEKQTFQTPLAIVLSNEGSGVAPWAKKAGNFLSIPLQNNIESLNVAIAGAILLYRIHEAL
ncbi:MAG TPA: RNA methyltransferase [Chlamydiales bacterium]|nr:RNA methyltransferase [Chlamydiales bacterium]